MAKVAKELGCLTVGVVTKPFMFEGKRRAKQADEGLRELKASVDTLITIPNQRLLAVAGRNSSIVETFKKADDVLLQAVRGIADLITVHGLINLDFADVRAIMAEMGMAMMGAAIASGENRAAEAAQKAISSPLLEEVAIKGARGVLINITGGPDLTLHEVNEAASLIQEEADEDANIIFGAVVDESMGDEVRITVIATGFGESTAARRGAAPAARGGVAAGRGGGAARSRRRARRPADPPHGLREVDEYELEVPTWQRRQQAPPVAVAERAGARAARATASTPTRPTSTSRRSCGAARSSGADRAAPAGASRLRAGAALRRRRGWDADRTALERAHRSGLAREVQLVSPAAGPTVACTALPGRWQVA